MFFFITNNLYLNKFFIFYFYDELITKICNQIMKKLLILILFLNGFIMATL
jgi:hypothetical protein